MSLTMMTLQGHIKRQRHIKRCKQAAWNHWKNEENRQKWKIGIVHQLFKGQDVKGVQICAGRSYLE